MLELTTLTVQVPFAAVLPPTPEIVIVCPVVKLWPLLVMTIGVAFVAPVMLWVAVRLDRAVICGERLVDEGLL